MRLRDWTVGLAGWRRRLLAAMLGVLAATALPPVHLLPFLIPAFVGLVWLVESSGRLRAAFAVGWWFGFGHFVAGLYWIAFALLIEPEKFAWMIPFAVFGLAAGFAVFPALATLATAASRLRGVAGVLVLGAAWTALEWVRGWAFTGFPWNLIGTVWVVSDGVIQIAAIVGVHGLSLLTVIAAAMPAAVAGGAGRRAAHAAIGVFVVLGIVWAGGLIRLAGAADQVVPGVRLRLVQANIPQRLKWRPELRRQHVERQIRMSTRPPDPASGGAPPTHVIWGETMVPFALAGNPELLSSIAGATPPRGVTIVGALRTTQDRTRPVRVWNSLHAVDSRGRVVGSYDKFHLLPFGEYVPFRRFLKFAKVTEGRGDFAPGPGLVTLRLPGLPPVSPLICYEVIFPGEVLDRRDRPQWLLNLTNDSWFGSSPGPHQHFAAARLRAVEEGVPLVRVANTGITAVVDAYGRTVARLGLGREGVIDADLPAALEGVTVYGLLGDRIVLVMIVVVAAAAIPLRKRP